MRSKEGLPFSAKASSTRGDGNSFIEGNSVLKDWKNNEGSVGNAYIDIETTNINPREGRVITVAMLYDDADDALEVGGNGESEKYILQRTSSWLSRPLTYVGFSSSRFDIPFLNYRLKVHRLPTIRLTRDNHLDLQMKLP